MGGEGEGAGGRSWTNHALLQLYQTRGNVNIAINEI